MSTYTVTAIAPIARGQATELEKARAVAMRLGALRKDIWNKYGGLQAWGADSYKLEREFKQTNPCQMYGTDMKCWNRTFLQVIDDIKMTHAAIRTEVFKKIYRYIDKPEQKEAFNKLRTLEFLKDNRLHRWVRNESHRGHTEVDNHIVLTHNGGALFQREGRLTKVTFSGSPIEGKNNRYEKITLKFRTGKVDLKGYGTVIFHDDGVVRLHYPVNKEADENPSTEVVGVDKGYTEALYGDDGIEYGAGIGKIMTTASDKMNLKGKRRNQLHALAKNTEDPQKTENIIKNNLGRLKLDKTTAAKQQQLKSIIRKDVNLLFKQYGKVVCEDLSQPIKSKQQFKKMNRRLSNWCKSEIHKSLEEIALRTGSVVQTINPSYTSQCDPVTHTLLGTRVGDRFTRYTGDVIHADISAASVIKHRGNDTEITRYMRAEEVQRILLKRTAIFLAGIGKTLEDAFNLGWLDIKHLCAAKKYGHCVLSQELAGEVGAVSAAAMKPRKNHAPQQAANKKVSNHIYPIYSQMG